MARAQGAPGGPFVAPPSVMPPAALLTPGVLPTDATPIGINRERGLLAPEYKFRLNQRLPERLWFTSTTEVSQRLDTNVLFTKRRPRPDYAFRALPNITLGYNVLKRTSVYTNYFVIKDVFAELGRLSTPTTQSLSFGLRHDIPLGRKTDLQLDFQARELWQVRRVRQADLLPSINITHTLTPRSLVFGSIILQMRGKEYFTGATREIDPFYTIGYVRNLGQYTFLATNTLVTNFRNTHTAIVPQGNVSMISDIELSRPIVRSMPGLQAFIRAEPIWNWRSNNFPGISGFDFRLYTGMRLSAAKPSYSSSISDVQKKILNMEKEQKQQRDELLKQDDTDMLPPPNTKIMPITPPTPSAPGLPATPPPPLLGPSGRLIPGSSDTPANAGTENVPVEKSDS